MANQGAIVSTETKCSYDVFLSFRGEDTRHGFTGHLYGALCRKGINTFMDDEELREGEQIGPALVKAIQESRISIVVLSGNYAASSWCLDELVTIMECAKERNQLVWPIFYKVEPSEVRHQRNSYGEAMAKHEDSFGIDSEKVQRWKSTLKEVSNLKGDHFKEEYEFKFIQDIVSKASIKLTPKQLDIDEHIVGLESRVEEVKSLLDIESNNITCMLGIHGTGGIGKTTLAKTLYNSISIHFEGACFLFSVRETSNQFEGQQRLQRTLLSEILGEDKIQLASVIEGTRTIKRRLGLKRVLVVLDDVDDIKQLETLAGGLNWFGLGSRIIITTRDKHLLDAYEVEKRYEMKVLNDHESLELFCHNAFKMNHPATNYEELSSRAMHYCKGLPLALKVIGSIFKIHKDLNYLRSALDKYERNPHRDIQSILKISFDSLDFKERDIFLDIACFFKGQRLEYIKNILHACDFNPEDGIENLVGKSLISAEDGSLRMHDLIQAMGKEIVWQEAPKEAGERSRLWFHEDVLEVLTENTGSNKIEGIMLDPPQREEVNWIDTAFEKMKKLRILIIRNTRFSSGPKYLSNHLRLLYWKEYPSESFPLGFYPKKIVSFNLRGSPLVLEKPFQKFEHLTYMNVSYCQSITQIPNVSGAQNIRELRLDGCEKLVTVDESIGFLPNLVHLSASECTRLKTFVPRICLPSLEYLSFNFCRSLEHFPNIVGKMDKPLKIFMIATAIKKLPHSIGKLTGLDYIEMTGCTELQGLPDSLFMLPNLVTLKITGCSKLRESFRRFRGSDSAAESRRSLGTLQFDKADLSDEDVHAIIQSFPNLEDLNLSWNDFVSLPSCIRESVYLTSLNVSYCGNLQEIPKLPLSVQKVDARHCHSLTSDSSSILWSQVREGKSRLEVLMPKTEIPEWFNHRDRVGIPLFWVRRKFPAAALAFVFEDVDPTAKGPLPVHWRPVGLHLFVDGNHVRRRHYHSFIIEEHHVILCDLRVLFTDEEWQWLDARCVGDDWKTVQIDCETELILSCWGVYVYEQETDMENIQFQFTSPNICNKPWSLVPKSEEEILRNKIESMNLQEIFEGTLIQFKDLEQRGDFDKQPPSVRESLETVLKVLGGMSLALRQGKVQEDDDDDGAYSNLKWMAKTILEHDEKEEGGAAGPSGLVAEYDEEIPVGCPSTTKEEEAPCSRSGLQWREGSEDVEVPHDSNPPTLPQPQPQPQPQPHHDPSNPSCLAIFSILKNLFCSCFSH